MPGLIAPVIEEKQETEVKLSSEFIARAVVRLLKQDIFERYMETRKLPDEDWKFCEMIDWHPVDELPLKESFVKELEEARNEPSIRLKSVSEIFE